VITADPEDLRLLEALGAGASNTFDDSVSIGAGSFVSANSSVSCEQYAWSKRERKQSHRLMAKARENYSPSVSSHHSVGGVSGGSGSSVASSPSRTSNKQQSSSLPIVILPKRANSCSKVATKDNKNSGEVATANPDLIWGNGSSPSSSHKTEKESSCHSSDIPRLPVRSSASIVSDSDSEASEHSVEEEPLPDPQRPQRQELINCEQEEVLERFVKMQMQEEKQHHRHQQDEMRRKSESAVSLMRFRDSANTTPVVLDPGSIVDAPPQRPQRRYSASSLVEEPQDDDDDDTIEEEEEPEQQQQQQPPRRESAPALLQKPVQPLQRSSSDPSSRQQYQPDRDPYHRTHSTSSPYGRRSHENPIIQEEEVVQEDVYNDHDEYDVDNGLNMPEISMHSCSVASSITCSLYSYQPYSHQPRQQQQQQPRHLQHQYNDEASAGRYYDNRNTYSNDRYNNGGQQQQYHHNSSSSHRNSNNSGYYDHHRHQQQQQAPPPAAYGSSYYPNDPYYGGQQQQEQMPLPELSRNPSWNDQFEVSSAAYNNYERHHQQQDRYQQQQQSQQQRYHELQRVATPPSHHRQQQQPPPPPQRSLYQEQQQKQKKQQLEIEIEPGTFVPLRGTEETLEAMNIGFVIHTSCIACTSKVMCIGDAEYVLCPVCKVVSPVEQNLGHGGGVGLGFQV